MNDDDPGRGGGSVLGLGPLGLSPIPETLMEEPASAGAGAGAGARGGGGGGSGGGGQQPHQYTEFNFPLVRAFCVNVTRHSFETSFIC